MFIFNSKFHDHKVTDKNGKVVAEFVPTPRFDPKEGQFPTHGVFTTDDAKLAKTLKDLGRPITLAPGSEDPDAASAPKASADGGKAPGGDQGGKQDDQGKK